VFGVQVGLVVLVSILFCFKSLDITNFPTRTHLGTETDQLLQMVITGVFKDGIIITVAHRLNDILFAIGTIVLNTRGWIGFGTPAQLIERPFKFKDPRGTGP
jgi:ABC-type transport system involved in cytochrome bd biosynthesis fused ATPase/permease subunit